MAKAVRSKAVSSASGTGKKPAGVKSTPPVSEKKAAPTSKAPAQKPAKAAATAMQKSKALPTTAKLKRAATTTDKPVGKATPIPQKAAPKSVGKTQAKAVAPAKPAGKKGVAKAPAKKAPARKASKPASPKVPAQPVKPPVQELGNPMIPQKVKRILITLPQPDGDKSPYFDLAKKQHLTIDFFPFISVEGLTGKEFRQQKIDFNQYTAVVFTSRLAVDHFFRIMEEVRIKVSQDLKYFCITEAVALYLQKFIMYRKRKVFFSADGSTQGLLDVIGKHKQEKYMVSTADGVKKEIPAFLKKYKIVFAEAALYRTVSNNISPAMAETRYDMILFFSPYSVQALFEQAPGYQQRDTVMGAFGPSTAQAVEAAGLRLDIKAPAPKMPSMVASLEHFFEGK